MGEADRLARMMMERSAALTLFARQWVDACSAEDVVQEALVALLMQRKTPDDPVAWMFRTVRNGAIDYCRTATNRRKRERVVAQGRGEWFEASVETAMDAGAAEAALRMLEPEDRQVVVLRIWGDLNFAQIGRIMDLSVSSVHGRYAAALEKLRHAMEKSCRNKTI